MLTKFIKDAELRLPDFEDSMILRNTLETSDVMVEDQNSSYINQVISPSNRA